jgi:hypothetical protein
VADISHDARYDGLRAAITPARQASGPIGVTSRRAPDALADIPAIARQSLAARAVEPNGYYLPGFDPEHGVQAFAAWDHSASNFGDCPALIGALPVVSAWRAYGLPLPIFVNADRYDALGTPSLDRDHAKEAAHDILRQARAAGAHALVLRNVALDGPAVTAFGHALADLQMTPRILRAQSRAVLDARRDPDELLREALGAKKLKELRRQRKRLEDIGDVVFTIAATPHDIAPALEVFLSLEASGWKGARGTALAQSENDATFIRNACLALAERGQCEILSLYAGNTPVAAAIVLRHLDRAFFFKIGIDEQFAKFSPGVLLTMELTRHLCADADISVVDSTAPPGHPMIEPIWRNRMAIGDVLLPLYRHDPMLNAIHAALAARAFLRRHARSIVKKLRRALHAPRQLRRRHARAKH